ncbi:MAG: hypothetical protein BWZ10_00425 [candidate division BRC1 bacterium ADurb.BinA364]|nr:MAG: hypothetical protein BWZ10_00425 [candidate division BRC1 bacterium ADurb.BinA364]
MADALQFAFDQNRHTVANHFGVRQNVRGEEDGFSLFAQPQDDVAHLLAPQRIEARLRLVEEDQFGIVQQRLGQPDALIHALGIALERQIGGVRQADQFQQFADFAAALAPGHAVELAVKIKKFAPGQIIVEIRILGQKSDLGLHRPITQRFAHDACRARRREVNAHQNLDGRGFSGAIRAKQAEDLAFFHVQREIVQRAHLAVADVDPQPAVFHANEVAHIGFGQIAQFDDRHSCALRLRELA